MQHNDTDNNARIQPVSGRTRRNITLPKPRSKRSERLIYLVSLVFFFVSVFISQGTLSWINVLFVLISVLLPLLCVIELAFRIIYLFEESRHVVSRYDGKRFILLKDVFYFTPYIYVISLCSCFTFIIIYIIHNEVPYKLWYDLGPTSIITSLIGVKFLERNLQLNCGPLYNSLWIENSNGLDYGSGLAHSFFHGYLRLIIPKTGGEEKNLEELMKDYEDKHNVKLELYKLFILIPKSLYCPTSLMDKNISPSIEESSSLAPIELTVAGVQRRVYKNSVYKIVSENKRRLYVSAEYATPLKTFKDVVTYNGEHSNHYNKHKNDIVLQFYLTLKKVLKEHENCKDFCELIYYDDKDANGKYKDVGQILQQRINKLK